ncbi:MAG: hypothetical protein SGJ07_07515 [Rhodospirillaceae bacterium]|nr:hypothetical protein [Rhodospirillaceae bacterium]
MVATTKRLVPALLLVASIAGFVPGAQAQEITRCGELPAPVAEKRDAIAAAAEAGDLEALVALTDPTEFTYSFGDGDGDGALDYWQSMRDEEGVDPADLLTGLLAAGCAHYDEGGDSFYVWPAAALVDYIDLTPQEIEALQILYNGELVNWYVEGFAVGYYVGWRFYIEPHGRWTAFVAGD